MVNKYTPFCGEIQIEVHDFTNCTNWIGFSETNFGRAAFGTTVNNYKKISGSLNVLKFKYFLSSIKKYYILRLKSRGNISFSSEVNYFQRPENDLNCSSFSVTEIIKGHMSF